MTMHQKNKHLKREEVLVQGIMKHSVICKAHAVNFILRFVIAYAPIAFGQPETNFKNVFVCFYQVR